jgi:hypothetical protein
MHQMPVDIEQAGAVRLFVDQMVVPDFVVERARATRSKTGLDRRRHAAEKAPRQAIVIAQHEGRADIRQMPGSTGFHGLDITIQD